MLMIRRPIIVPETNKQKTTVRNANAKTYTDRDSDLTRFRLLFVQLLGWWWVSALAEKKKKQKTNDRKNDSSPNS